MNEKTAQVVFWIVHLPLMGLFLVGMWLVFTNWLKGSVAGRADASVGQKIGILARIAARTIFSARLGLLIKAFITEAWFNRRLYRNNRWRWLNHFLLLTGFMLLTALSGISALSDKILIPFFHLEYVPWIGMWMNPDHPVPALLNDTGALLMTAGFLFFAVRRYLFRVPQLRTAPLDTWMAVGLGLILLSGWTTEIARLSSSRVGTTAYFAFAGYPLAQLAKGLPIPWDAFAAWMYVIHGLFTSIVIATAPFSKFMHAIAGALVAMVREMEAGNARIGMKEGASHVQA